MPAIAVTGETVAERLEMERYVRTVFIRLATANADLCRGHVMAEFGLRFANLDSLGPDLREAALADGLLSDIPVVFFAGAGLPAAQAGVRVGDQLIGIEGRRLGPGEPARGQFSATVSRALRQRGAVDFLMGRANREFEVAVTPVPSCAANVFLDTMAVPNAFTNGEDVLILAGLLDVARTEAELAVVIGHELGHILAEQKYGPGHRNADPMAAEMEADRLGLYLAARAGYDVSGTTVVMERIMQDYPLAAEGGENHPSSALRIAAMKATEREIEAMRKAGLPLLPGAPDS